MRERVEKWTSWAGTSHKQSSINIIQENNSVITTEKGKGKLPLFCGNVEYINTIYALTNSQYMLIMYLIDSCSCPGPTIDLSSLGWTTSMTGIMSQKPYAHLIQSMVRSTHQ